MNLSNVNIEKLLIHVHKVIFNLYYRPLVPAYFLHFLLQSLKELLKFKRDLN